MVRARPSAKEVFMDAVELPEEERGDYIARACGDDPALRGRVESLIRAHLGASAVLGKPTPPVLPASTVFEEELSKGEVIHAYRLVESIGAGGFGEVWLAEQERPLRRLVALKVLKVGMDTKEVVARFEAERQALAIMDHPGIAKVHDAGTTPRGRPYFVMELVDGLPVTEFCEEHRLGTQARVQLVRDVCVALEHAHQKGVVHRDIKPNNVLVVEQDGVPVPKVIDFGIAKAVGGRLAAATIHTRDDQVLGTPGYMSPEQLDEGMDVDTRTDVYSTGALLYELLAGRPPIDVGSGNLGAIQQRIANEEPKRPSTWLESRGRGEGEAPRALLPRREVQGDLDWISMRCLEKDRERRYDSMGLLAEDLRRYLAGEPVSAGPPTLGYRASKFARRNWQGLTAVGVILVLLVSGIVVSTDQARLAREAEVDAQDQARIARAAEQEARDQAELARAAEQEAREQAALARAAEQEAQDQADLARAAEQEAREELVRATAVARFLEDLFMTIDPAHAGERDTELIEEILAKAEDRVEEESQGLPRVEAQLRHIIAGAHYAIGKWDRAVAQWKVALELREQEFGFVHVETLNTASSYAPILGETGDYEGARALLERTLEGHRKYFGPSHEETIRVLNNLAVVLHNLGADAEAEPIMRELEEVSIAKYGREHEKSLLAMNNYASLLRKIGRPEEALERFEWVVEQQEAQNGLGHPRTLASIGNLAGVYGDLGNTQKAEELHGLALEEKRKIYQEGHPSLLISMNNLARYLSENGSYEEGNELRAEAIESSIEHHGLANRFTLTLLMNEGKARVGGGEWEEAEEPLRIVLEHAPGVFASQSSYELTAAAELARALCELGRYEEAEELMKPYVGRFASAFPATSNAPEVFRARYGIVLHELGRGIEALPYLEAGARELDPSGSAGELHERVVAVLEGREDG